MTDNEFRKKILERLTARNARESAFHEIIFNSELEKWFSIVFIFVFVHFDDFDRKSVTTEAEFELDDFFRQWSLKLINFIS
jgi:hypothetical protein